VLGRRCSGAPPDGGPSSVKVAIGRFPAVQVNSMSGGAPALGRQGGAPLLSVADDDARRVPLIAAKTDRATSMSWSSIRADGTLIAAGE
jgi:hypothetical protein